MKCPTCIDAKENKCFQCGIEIPIDERELTTDPFGYEINGNESLHLMCIGCYNDSASNI